MEVGYELLELRFKVWFSVSEKSIWYGERAISPVVDGFWPRWPHEPTFVPPMSLLPLVFITVIVFVYLSQREWKVLPYWPLTDF